MVRHDEISVASAKWATELDEHLKVDADVFLGLA